MRKLLPTSPFVGRTVEISRLREISKLDEASIIVVHGRRRVGKTSLVQHVFYNRKLLKFEGIEGQSQAYQINSFLKQLAKYFKEPKLEHLKYTSWREPLMALASRVKRGKVTIFLEELQWMANYDSQLISELKFIWDNHLRYNSKLLLVLCGSAPSFMINDVLRSKSLYNRSLHEIALKPLSVIETKQFLGKYYSEATALEAHLLVGGVPEYLKYLKLESSTYLSFCKNAFLPDSFFLDEPKRLFVSSLANKSHYQDIIELIGRAGILSRAEILKKLKASSGSNITRVLKDLELGTFIKPLRSFDSTVKSKLVRYELTDPFLRIYYKFIERRVTQIRDGAFQKDYTKPMSLRDLSQILGYSFEHYCRSNAHLIAEALSFAGVDYHSGPLLSRDIGNGVQLDLVFNRKDKVLTVCEMKYSNEPIGVNQVKDFRQKLGKLKITPRQRLQTVLIAPGGVTESLRSAGIFDKVLGVEIFFRE